MFQYIQKDIFHNSLSIKLKCFDDPQFYSDFTKASMEAKTRAIDSQNLFIKTIIDFIALDVLVYVVVQCHIGFLAFVMIPVLLHIGLGKKLDTLIYAGDMKAAEANRKADYVNRTFFLKNCSKEIKTSNMKEVLFRQFRDAVNEVIKIRKDYGKQITTYKTILIIVSNVICYIATVVFALVLLHNSVILMGDFVFLLTSLNTVSQRLQTCIDDCFQIYNSRNYIENLQKFSKALDESELSVAKPPAFKKIEFKNVLFQYTESGKKVLSDVNLSILSGERIAIIGENGAGKTTFLKLLLGLYDAVEGEIKLNDCAIEDYDRNSYHRLFSCVFQDFELFGCTVGENVLCRKVKEEDRKNIERALEMSGLSVDMERKGITIDSLVTKEFDDNGVVFSGGQLQKLAIARAFANNRQIVVLDEPSSALDPIAEYDMFEKFKKVYENKTLIYVTHRISSSILADKICFFESGKIVEMGTHDELMHLNGKYAELYRIQSKPYLNS